MLDFGWSEFFLVVILAIILLGPKEIPEILYWIGRGVRRLQYLKFALSQQFDGFMHQVDLHDLKSPGKMIGGGLPLTPPPVVERPGSPVQAASAVPAVDAPLPIHDPVDDEDSDYYADFPEAAAPAASSPSDKVSADVLPPR